MDSRQWTVGSGNRGSVVLVGSRSSQLALTQSRWVADALARAWPGLTFEIVHITTTGDRRTEPLPAIGGKGLFTKELEEALLRGEIDLAVHSLKDLPTELPEGLTVGAIPCRAPVSDALITATGVGLAGLPSGALVGTSSLRRGAQLLRARPDLRTAPIRGNVETRLRKVREGQFDATVLALAGLTRLGLADRASEVLPLDVMLPAPGQGALGIEIRAADARVFVCHTQIAELVAAIHDAAAAAAVTAERALLAALGGGCSLPLGACAQLDGDALRLRAVLLSPDGTAACRADRTGPASDPVGLAEAAAADLRAAGADRILESL